MTADSDNENLSQIIRERDVYKAQLVKIQTGYETKIKELSILKELGETLRLINELDSRIFWENQLEVLMHGLFFDNISLSLFDSGRQVLDTVAMVGEAVKDENESVAEINATKEAFSKKEPVIIEEGRVPEGMNTPDITRSILCLPILHNKSCIGVLRFRQKNNHIFDPNMIRFLSLVAESFATGIILSRIYGQLIQEERYRFNLSRFFSAKVREKIINTSENLRLGGERKYVTILFADLQGFTSLSEKLDHERVVEILNSYFSLMTPIIFKYHGTLDKLMGDGMLALFGAPLSQKDAPCLAVQTALDMQKALVQFNDEHREPDWPELKLTVGINAGEVVAGYIGSEEHMNYTVIGDAVNVAQRIQSVAAADQILISGVVHRDIKGKLGKLTDDVTLQKLPARPLKGKEQEVEIYEVNMVSQFSR